MKFCCEQMVSHINNDEKIIYYEACTRTFAIRVSKRIVQQIQFCPWCGEKLQENLRKELAQIIFEELGLDDLFDDPRMPEEYKTDEWWKKRGL